MLAILTLKFNSFNTLKKGVCVEKGSIPKAAHMMCHSINSISMCHVSGVYIPALSGLIFQTVDNSIYTTQNPVFSHVKQI